MFGSAPDRDALQKTTARISKVSQILKFGPQEGKAPWDHHKDTLVSYDYIVLGGGAAGSVVASRLAEDPAVNVLVLEAGYTDEIFASRVPSAYNVLFGSDADWNYETVPQTHAGNRTLMQPRGKILGGCSSINAMMYHRGPASDYDEWESLGNPGWSFNQCLPYFKKSEGFNDPNLPSDHPHGPLTNRVRFPELETFDPEAHGTEGPWQVTFHHLFQLSKQFIVAGQAEGIPFNKDFNGESTLGVNRIQTFIQRDGVRSSLSRAFLRSKDVVPGGAKYGRGTVRVVFGADAKRILFQVKRGVKMAAGIEFVDHNNVRRRVMATREVLLCAGAFGSPQLLLASGLGPSPQPSIPHFHTLAGVGANLQDHLGISAVFRARDRLATFNSQYSAFNSIKSLFSYVTSGTGPLTCQLGEGVIFVRLEDIAPEWVAQEKANGTYQERASGPGSPHLEVIILPGYVRRHGTILASDFKSYFTVTALLLNPCSAGSFKIATQPTKSGNGVEVKGVVDPNYLAESFDARALIQGLKFIRRIARRLNEDPEVGAREEFPGEADVPDRDDKVLEKYVREYSETYYHPVGTCKMGPASDKMSVVDHRLNVHGVERLRVIDASVMPKLVAAHTCAPTVMIAERAADFIKEDWSSSLSLSAPSTRGQTPEARL
ncbi:hypothetical protein BGX24_005595 [Mortierella sp. AD032]|nr:hypothetical protein BGX24_005595 [Mortierella sp. AD032]